MLRGGCITIPLGDGWRAEELGPAEGAQPRSGRQAAAVQVEDQPLEYAESEGVIPDGEYGARTVQIWDRGTWLPEGDSVKAHEHGALEFELRGERLRGGWALVHMSERELLAVDQAARRRSPSRQRRCGRGAELDQCGDRDIETVVAAARDRLWR